MRTWVQSVALLSGLRIWCCRELWCRVQTWLGSVVAVAVAAVIAPIQPLAWEPSYAVGAALNKQTNKQKTKKIQQKEMNLRSTELKLA